MEKERKDRILTEKEISQIHSLLKEMAEEYPDLYPNFEEWVDTAIDEIRKGKKKALGAWFEGELVGVAILKPTVSATVELKNFYVHREYRNRNIGTQLYELIEQESLSAKCTLIETDVPENLTGMIIFLIKRGWKLGSTGYPKYGGRTRSVILYKELPKTFTGNVHDWEEMARWVSEEIWGFKIINEHPSIEGKTFDGEGIKEENRLILKLLLEVKQTKNPIDIDEITTLVEIGNRKGYNLAFFSPSFTDRAKKYAEDRHVILISREDLQDLINTKIPELITGKPVGIILPIKKDFFDEFLKRRTYRMVYIRGGSKPLKVTEGNEILFYIISPHQKIMGKGTIVDFIEGAPDSVWKSIKSYSVFNQEEYERFVERKGKVWAVIFDNFEEIDGPSIEKLKEIFPTWNPQATWYVDEPQMRRIMMKRG